jgi:hypothetical protein
VFLITGGRNQSQVLPWLESFELGTGDWDLNRFAVLPEPVLEHCLVKLNDTMLMLIGGDNFGVSTSSTPKTYFFNVLENIWMEGPTLNISRKIHSCGVMIWSNPDTGNDEQVVVVAGGRYAATTASVELLYLNRNTGWVAGPTLPYVLEGSSMIQYQNSVILVAGRLGNPEPRNLMFQLKAPDGSWSTMRQSLMKPRYVHVAFLVPDNLVNCHY